MSIQSNINQIGSSVVNASIAAGVKQQNEIKKNNGPGGVNFEAAKQKMLDARGAMDTAAQRLISAEQGRRTSQNNLKNYKAALEEARKTGDPEAIAKAEKKFNNQATNVKGQETAVMNRMKEQEEAKRNYQDAYAEAVFLNPLFAKGYGLRL